MGRLTKTLLDTLVLFLPTLEKLEPGQAAIAFRDDKGTYDCRYIHYVFQNYSSYYGEGISVYDGHVYLATISIDVIKEWKEFKDARNKHKGGMASASGQQVIPT